MWGYAPDTVVCREAAGVCGGRGRLWVLNVLYGEVGSVCRKALRTLAHNVLLAFVFLGFKGACRKHMVRARISGRFLATVLLARFGSSSGSSNWPIIRAVRS